MSLGHRLMTPVTVFAVAFAGLLAIGGGPITNDEIKYLNTSTHATAEPWLLNRCAHIYLQKIFVWLAGEPLLGARIFWAFVVSLTIAVT